jgi:DNA-binding NarL/FixJ family response regulator
MKDQRARQILHSLVNGADPFSGEDLAAGTVLQNAEVIRAMLAGYSALEERTARACRRAQQPRNIGQTWTPEEQERLIQAFKSGENLEAVADRHGRTLRAIEARLEILGMITSEQRTTENRFGAAQIDGASRGGARRARAKARKAAG